MTRRNLTHAVPTLAALAVLVAVLMVVPAVGAPNPVGVAKKALRIATGTKKELKRSYTVAHPGEVTIVDGGERTAQPFGFASWTLTCPAGSVAVGTSVGYGALEPVNDLVAGRRAAVDLFNPSDAAAYDGNVALVCVWGAEDFHIAGTGGDIAAVAAEGRRARLEATR